MPTLSISLLGTLQIALGAQPVSEFKSDKVRALLAYLAVEADRPHRREALAALLWPEMPDRSARSNLRDALANLRQAIGDRTASGDHEATPPILLIERNTIQFNASSDHWLDVARFCALLEADRGDQPAHQQLTEAVELYRGGFLEGFSLKDSPAFDDWSLLTRERLQRQALLALSRLVSHYEAHGAYGQACDYARRQLELEPWDEEAVRRLMRLLALDGQRGAALLQYESCRQSLAEELGVEPAEETTKLFEQIRDGTLADPGVVPTTEAKPGREPRPVGDCPYRGLAAFRERDAPFFFGREDFALKLHQAVQQHPLVTVIVGSSGSGKSSVVAAGLLPRLREEGNWLIAPFRPGRRPFSALASALLPHLEGELSETDRLLETEKLAQALYHGELALDQVVERISVKQDGEVRLLLAGDQFEELYSLCPDPGTRRRFVDSLLAAAESGAAEPVPPLVILLSLRADFMGQALSHRPFADALQDTSLLLGPMTREEMQAAIEMPAQKQGAAFEAGLVNRILDDVGDEPGNLPLLEFALMLLWERADAGWLTHEAYDAIGRVDGALARYADEVYAALDEAQQDAARRVFLQLIRPGQGTEDSRRVATQAEIGEQNWPLTRHLADRRLVVTGLDSAGVQTVEVVHEALIGGWARLRAWMEADRTFRTWQEGLRAAQRQWELSDHDDGALLRGTPLAQAEGWLAERGTELSPDETDFIRASVALRQSRQARRERRRRWTLLALAGGLVIAVVLALLAAQQWQRASAEEQRARAEEQKALQQASVLLAGQAEAELEGGYGDRAVLLALEALERYPYTPQAEHALGQAVSYNRALQQYTAHQTAVTSVAWSPDGTRVASSASTDNDVHIWDPVTGETELVIDMPTGITGNIFDMTLNVQWSTDGQRLLTITGDRYQLGSQDYDVHLWDATSGELLSSVEIANQAEPVSGDLMASFVNYQTGSAADIAPQSGRLATLGGDNTAILWDADWQGPALLLEGHMEGVNSVDWSPDEAKLITASLDGTARIWDTASGEALQVLEGHEGPVHIALWSPDGAQVATGGQDGTLRIWHAASGDLASSIQAEGGEVTSLAWAPNGARIVSGQGDGSLCIWEVASDTQLETLRGHQGIITDLKWSPVDDRLVSADGNGNVRVWNAAQSTAWRLYPPQAERGGDWSVVGASWSSDGRYLAMAGGDGVAGTEPPSFNIWDVEANQLIMENLGDALNYNGAIAHFSPDDSAILYLGIEQFPDFSGLATAYVFDAQTGQIIQTFTPGGEDGIRSAAWSPDGSQVATGLFNGGALIWDVQTGNKVTKLVHDTPDMFSAAVQWSPDGSKFAAGFDDSIVRVWDARAWEELYAVRHEPPALINAVDWSPDGKYLLTAAGNDEQGSRDHTARIWDGATGEELLVFSGHTMSVWPGDWSPSGKRVVTSSNDGTVMIWDASTGDELLTLSVPVLYAVYAWWSPDGQHLAIAGNDTLVSVWRVWQTTEELVDYAKECCLFRELTDAEREQFALPPR